MLGKRFNELFQPRVDPAVTTRGLRAVLDDGEAVDALEFEAVRKDGVAFIARAMLRPLMDGGRIIGAIGTADDVTVHRRNDALLASQRQLMEMIAVGATLEDVLDQIARTVERQAPPARCSILLLDEDGVHLRPGAAPSMPETFVAVTDGLEIGPQVGTCGTAAWRGESVVSEDVGSDPLFEGVREVMASYDIAASWSVPILSGAGVVLGTFAIYHSERHVPTPHEEQTIAVFSHVAGIAIERTRAARKAAEQTRLLAEKSSQLENALDAERERARRDPLTGSLNHAVIADEVRRLIDDASVQSFALAMVDVDGLKAVNDTYGHQIGDEVLLAVAASLKTDGAIVGRYGGDEFVAILLNVDREAAARYRGRVTEALDAVDLRDPDTGSRIHIDASVGLAIYPEEGDAVEDLIKLSDSAMYASRRQRADLSASAAFARIHGSPGNLQEKLNLVAGRVNAGAGYDGVNFTLYGNAGPDARSASFSPDSNTAADEYSQTSMPKEEPGPLRILLEATRRPVIIDDVSTSEFTTPEQRQILASVGIRSGLVVPMVWRGTLVGAISVGSKRESAFGPRDAQFLTAIATQVTAIVRTAALVDDLQSASDRLLQAQTETVLMLAAAAEAHDDTTGRHLKRVRGIAQAIAIELGYNEAKAKEIGLAAVLHDIGKIRVPDYVLASSASLSDQEWALMKEHTVWGSEFLGSRGGFELAMQVARSHHERWDGSGYPDGLTGERIPEAAAITSVADSLDAMISDRPYRPGRPLDDAIHEIEAWSGRQFSPKVVDALLVIYRRGGLAYLTTDDIPQDLAA
jgi:diguanylate cyclase (GGDEF)-like protein